MTEPQRTMTITRLLDAPREVVFRAWTEPEHLTWFLNGDPGTDRPVEVDLRVGGAWRAYMVVDDETAYWTGGIYREIVPNERLSFVFGAVDGWPELDPDHLDDGLLATVTLTDRGDRTEMVFRFDMPAHLSAEQVRAHWASGMAAGWTMTLDRLITHFTAARR